MKQAQSSIEGIILITLMIFVFTVFMALSSQKVSETQQVKDQEAIKDVASVIDSEMKIALAAEDGYNRVFSIPLRAAGRVFNVTIYPPEKLKANPGEPDADHSEIVLKFTNYMPTFEYVLALPARINGTMCGYNHVRKVEGKINITCHCVRGFPDNDNDGYTQGFEIEICAEDLPYLSPIPSDNIDCDDTSSAKWQLIPCYPDRDFDTYTVAQEQACRGLTCEAPPDFYHTNPKGNDCDDSNPLTYQILSCYSNADSDDYGEGALADRCSGATCTRPLFVSIGTNCNAGSFSNSLNCYTTSC